MPSDSRETLQDGTSRRVRKNLTTTETSADFIVRETAKSITLPNGIGLAFIADQFKTCGSSIEAGPLSCEPSPSGDLSFCSANLRLHQLLQGGSRCYVQQLL